MPEPTFTLAVTGDLQLSRPLIRGDSEPDRDVDATYDLMREADLTFTNLEVPLTRATTGADKMITFRSDPEHARDLGLVGVDVVSVANNHALDYGTVGLLETLAAVEKVGLAAVGGGANLDVALAHRVLSAGRSRVAFLGLSCTLPAGYAADRDRPGIAPIRVFTRYAVDPDAVLEQPGTAPYVETTVDAGSRDQALAAVRRAREVAEVVVVGIHWGVPHGFVAQFQDALAEYQRPLGHALIDAGAHVVVGNHAHVLHGMEWYGGGVILYCLGNFLFHRLAGGTPVGLKRDYPPYSWKTLRSPINRLSCLARILFHGARPSEVELVPLVLDDTGEPGLAGSEDARTVLSMLDDMSRPLGSRVEAREGRGRLLPAGG